MSLVVYPVRCRRGGCLLPSFLCLLIPLFHLWEGLRSSEVRCLTGWIDLHDPPSIYGMRKATPLALGYRIGYHGWVPHKFRQQISL